MVVQLISSSVANLQMLNPTKALDKNSHQGRMISLNEVHSEKNLRSMAIKKIRSLDTDEKN